MGLNKTYYTSHGYHAMTKEELLNKVTNKLK